MLDGVALTNLDNVGAIERCIKDIAQLIGMELVVGPVTEILPNEGGFGVSSVAIIAQSTISIHTFPEYSYIYVDVFSCGEDFSSGGVRRILEATFDFREEYSLTLHRGRNHL